MRVGLEQLENDFSWKSSLRPYYHKVLGVADLGATADELATANKVDPAGQTIIKVVNRLEAVLLAMQDVEE